MALRLFSLIFFLFAVKATAQNLLYVHDTSLQVITFKKPSLNTKVNRQKAALAKQKKGYLLSYADSTGPLEMILHPGPFFEKVKIEWKGEKVDGENFTPLALANLAEIWLIKQENEGFPFAQVQFQLTESNDSVLGMRVIAEPGMYFTLDSILFGNTKFTYRFLKWSSGFIPSKPYNHSQMFRMSEQLSVVDGLFVSGEPQLNIENGALKVRMPVYKTSKDYLSGIVGLATLPVGKPVLTGELMGRFYNMFGAGVHTAFEWRSFRARSQELKLNGSVPYLAGSPVILGYNLYFEKFDTLFSNFGRGVQLKFPLGRSFSIITGAVITDRIRIFADAATVAIFHRLPDNPAARNSQYHLGFEWKKIPFNAIPISGTQVNFKAMVGDRRILRDAVIEQVKWISTAGKLENIYDSLERLEQIRTVNYKLSGAWVQYIKLKPWLVLKLAAEGSSYFAEQVFFNELERYGGIKNIRGFNEQSIFANQFYMGTTEIRFQDQKTGYIGPFYHFAHFRNQSNSQLGPAKGYLNGMGITAALNTGAGILKIAWALGISQSQSAGLNQSKFHFGISTDF